MNQKVNIFVIYILLPVILICYTAGNYYMSLNGISICNSSGCNITKTILSYPVDVVYILGISGCSTLLLFGIYGVIKKRFMLFNTLLVGMVLFETIFLSYLIIKTQEICLLCLCFYILLLFTLLLANFITDEFKILPISLLPFVFLPLLLLDIRKPIEINSQYTIIGTETCKHCKNTKEKLSNIINFKELDVNQTGDLLKHFQITTVPVMIIKNNNEFRILEGEDKILKEFIKEEPVKQTSSINPVTKHPTNPFEVIKDINLMDKKDGCSIIEAVKCD